MSESPDLFSQLKRIAQSLASLLRPWPLFLDFTAINLPSPISTATARATQNLAYFRANYALLILLIFFLSLITRPLALIAFFVALLAWIALYFSRDEPLSILGFEVNDWAVLAALLLSTVVILSVAGIWVTVIVAGVVAAGLVGLHAALRSTDDLAADDFEASPYGNLLDDEDDSPEAGGAYSQI